MPDGADPAFPAGVRGLRVLVVDDEAPALEELGYLLRRDHRVADVRTAVSADEALAALRGEAADAVFLDIRMPGTDGLTLAHLIGQMIDPPRVVFISAYDDHAVDAFGLQAADYLLKPVDPGRLAEAVRRVATKPRDTGPEGETIPVELGGVTRFVNRSDVRYVEAQGDYARLHTARVAPGSGAAHHTGGAVARGRVPPRSPQPARERRAHRRDAAGVRALRRPGGRCDAHRQPTAHPRAARPPGPPGQTPATTHLMNR
jgi:CheY-like chemotaxis protein